MPLQIDKTGRILPPNEAMRFLEREVFGHRKNVQKLFNYFTDTPKIDKIQDPYEEFITMCHKNIAWASLYICNVDVAPFQYVILDRMWRKKYVVLVASRGGTKSYCLALYSCLRAALTQGCKIILVAASFRQSKQIFGYCADIWRKSPLLREINREGPKNLIDRCVLELGDSSIMAIPLGSAGEKIRGLRANVIICDEKASVPDEVFQTTIKGFGVVPLSFMENIYQKSDRKELERIGVDTSKIEENILGNQLILSGTASYKFNPFYNDFRMYSSIIQNKGNVEKIKEELHDMNIDHDQLKHVNYKDLCVMRVPYNAVEYIFDDTLKANLATLSKPIVQMEYLAEFVGDSDGFFKRSLIEDCVGKEENRFCPILFGNKNKVYIVGIDPARNKDMFAIVVLELDIGTGYRRVVYCWSVNEKVLEEKYGKSGPNITTIDGSTPVAMSIDTDVYKSSKVGKQRYYKYCADKIRELVNKRFPVIGIAMDSAGGGQAVRDELRDESTIESIDDLIWENLPDYLGKPGKHVLQLIDFTSKWISQANHQLRSDMEHHRFFLPINDAVAADRDLENRVHGYVPCEETLDDTTSEIEELKNEMSRIVVTLTQNNLEHFDLPKDKVPGVTHQIKRKDRYSALILANFMCNQLITGNRLDYGGALRDYKPSGGTIQNVQHDAAGDMYTNLPHTVKSPYYQGYILNKNKRTGGRVSW